MAVLVDELDRLTDGVDQASDLDSLYLRLVIESADVVSVPSVELLVLLEALLLLLFELLDILVGVERDQIHRFVQFHKAMSGVS